MIKLKSLLKESFGTPSPARLIPDDEEKLWQILQNLPEDHALQFTSTAPKREGLLIFLRSKMGMAATCLSKAIGKPDGKWHKADDITQRVLTAEIFKYGENNDVYYSTVPVTPNK